LAALARVVFGNPFSAQRSQLIVRLAPGAKLGDLTNDREALARVVAARLAPLLGDGAAGLRSLAEKIVGPSSRRCSMSAITAACRSSTR
jgi:hypothetical protein